MLGFIPKRPDYRDWIKVVAAVGDALPDADAIELLCEWSPEEREGEYAEKLRHRLPNVTVRTLFYLAKQYGWVTENPHPSPNPEAAPEPPKDRPAPDSGGSSADDETLSRLAAMPPLEYERIREAEAKRLGLPRISALDKLVEERRAANPRNDSLQGEAVSFPEIEPWPEPVNGADVLDEISRRLAHYVWFPAGTSAADTLALWAAYTHCYHVFDCAPLLHCSSPEKRSGKTITLEVLALFVPRPLSVDNVSTAALFRVTAQHKPILLADECDTWLPNNEELRGLFNSGYRRNKKYMRCVGDDQEPRLFDCFTPKALGGIGLLPGTMLDRAIPVRLERAKKGEVQARFDSRNVEIETVLCRKLARFIADNRARLEGCDPKLPDNLYDRGADNWRPLFAIAEIASADWPQRCADASRKLLTSLTEDVETLRVMLLTDLQQIFAGNWPRPAEDEEPQLLERIFSKDLCEKLAEMKDRPWPEVSRGNKPITERWLARNLAAFGIGSKNVRIGDEQSKGYEAADFKSAFERYVIGVPPLSKRPTVPKNGNIFEDKELQKSPPFSQASQAGGLGTDKKEPFTREWDGGTDKIGGTPEKGAYEAPKDVSSLSHNVSSPSHPKPPEETKPAPNAEPAGVSTPFMITHAMKAELLRRGYTQTEINKMSPQEAVEILKVMPPVIDEDGVGRL
jgi:putative DNA primase/helicase